MIAHHARIVLQNRTDFVACQARARFSGSGVITGLYQVAGTAVTRVQVNGGTTATISGPVSPQDRAELVIAFRGPRPTLCEAEWTSADGSQHMIATPEPAAVDTIDDGDIQSASKFFEDVSHQMRQHGATTELENIRWMRETLLARIDKRWIVYRDEGRGNALEEMLVPRKDTLEACADVLSDPLEQLQRSGTSLETALELYAKGTLKRNDSGGGLPDGADFCMFAEFFFAANTELNIFREHIAPAVRAAFIYFDHFGTNTHDPRPPTERCFDDYGSVLLDRPIQRSYPRFQTYGTPDLAELFGAELYRACPLGVMIPDEKKVGRITLAKIKALASP